MKKFIATALVALGFAGDASAQCGSQGRFPRARALVARLTPVQPVFPRLRAVVAPPRLVGLSGGCVPVIEYPAQKVTLPLETGPGVLGTTPSTFPLKPPSVIVPLKK